MAKGKRTLREVLTGALKIQIDEIWRKGKDYHGSQKGETIQDTKHCEVVEVNLDKLIQSRNSRHTCSLDTQILYS